jgi:hypothetical protein
LEDHEVEGSPRVVKDIATALSEQDENISVPQLTVVADAHGGIFSKRFSGSGSFVISCMFRGGVPVGHERSQLPHFRVVEVLDDVVAVHVAVCAVITTTAIFAAVIVAPAIVAAAIIALLDDFAQLTPDTSKVYVEPGLVIFLCGDLLGQPTERLGLDSEEGLVEVRSKVAPRVALVLELCFQRGDVHDVDLP